MIIEKIVLNNFRQYKDTIEIDLRTSSDSNIVLIGGLNGYGKTNLLIAFVWCLFGEKIEKSDERFRKHIQKSGSYSKFLDKNLNLDYKANGGSEYSVKVVFSDVTLPGSKASRGTCFIERKVNTDIFEESLEVKFKDQSINPLRDNEEKVNFINDFIVPLDAAKFIFFDAEKISRMAELSAREEGDLMNDALSNILGLDVYEDLAKDLSTYVDQLRKENIRGDLKSRIDNVEFEINLSEAEIDRRKKEILSIESSQEKMREKIKRYEIYISENASEDTNSDNIGQLYKKRDRLSKNVKDFEKSLNNIIELIPFAIAGPIVEEVVEQINKQDQLDKSGINDLKEISEEFVEKLFNKPEFPSQENDLTFKGKLFYSKKAQEVFLKLLAEQDNEDYDFNTIHDFTNSDKDLLNDTYSLIKDIVNSEFLSIYTKLRSDREEIQNIDSKIRMIESHSESEEVSEYRERKEALEEKLSKSHVEVGKLESKIEEYKEKKSNNLRVKEQLLKKSKLSAKNKKELEVTSNYIDALNEFIVKEKEKRSIHLAQNIYDELSRLMHKMKRSDNFIDKVTVKPLPDNEGLNITLHKSDGEIFNKESLSEGEKQLYISSVIKSLLNEAVQDFPIVIDTPLGRLDRDHRNMVLKEYYPTLSKQVILMSTDSEITPNRKNLIDEHIERAYLLKNSNGNSKIAEGYFN